ncbi:Rossmann fold nucleotide-binding protein [Tessaracoccus rhinocerotis]|uniref:Rossmann fold nucleotide-binding protein n=1 Tax=Tessaracoccus rhinocerotis TaxID=1689449 RepID=A0A553K4W8_9ACTN|nr:LOG family protein [Tessaracoccus rhinocerotis]TRY19753.1 Rossmann fold nucleotide-binding protein [Tessaracoccus rhinocerotis]
MRTEMDTLAQFDDAVAAGGDLSRAVLQSLDLRHRDDALRTCRVDGALVLGCRLSEEGAQILRAGGALLFPRLPDAPLNTYRAHLYTPIDLFDTYPTGTYEDSLDARGYAWTRGAAGEPSLDQQLAESLHDHAIAEALDDYLDMVDPVQVVGVMGGHALQRGSEGYAATARLGMQLALAGKLVASGGGPGAMEAANLGARLAPHGPQALAEALRMLATVPRFVPSVDDWAKVAFEVKAQFSGGSDNLGIPTWFYGHEPPNVFASQIAKFCSNALREDILLKRCRGGLVYLPGAAGTVQELFQAVTGNYYAEDPSTITPLVLVGVEQWTRTLPAWPLLSSLAAGKPMADAIRLVDTVEEAGEFLIARVARR